MSQKKKVSIVVRCFNEAKHLERLFTGIRNQQDVEAETVFVDSGSTDESVSIAQKYGCKVVFIRPEDFTFGRALNIGCQAATQEVLVICSSHVYPSSETWLRDLIAPFENPKVAVAYGKQRGNELTRFSELQVFKKQFPDVGSADQAHPFCNNANAAIRRSLWAQRPYDETLTGLEDLDWARWAVFMGYKVAYVPQAEIIHVHQETAKQIRNRYKREAIAIKRIFPHTHLNVLQFLFVLLGNVLMDCVRATLRGKIVREFTGILIYRFSQYTGTYEGLHYKDNVTMELINRYYYPRGITRDHLSRLTEGLRR